MKKLSWFATGILAIVLIAGCGHPSSSGTPAASGPPYFQTSFQEESQYIVEAIVTDLTEQLYYAKFHRLPDASHFKVVATSKGGSPHDAPIYELQVQIDPKLDTVNSEVNVNGPIWSPAVYQNVAADLAKAIGLTPSAQDETPDTSMLSKLTDSAPETIEQQDKDLSSALENNFTNPELHEKAAALLGAF